MYKKLNVMQQIKTHIVALISLVTALSGLLYNNWRDHQNELNHNMRNAAFEVLKDLGELQTIVNYAHFEADSTRGNPIEGWKYAIQVRDLSRLLSPASQQKGKQLYLVWEKDWDTLNEDSVSEQRISQQIAETRSAVLTAIDTLQ
ncbi:hypothetical protein Meth11DRAFT_2602 [Methylophilaceae bacterium 11]|nr:hypothetical protein Meth11DRAFT_2602 [Methylophilaceae bacterium 11]